MRGHWELDLEFIWDLNFGIGDFETMRFIADFHLHSKYSRATSKEMEVEALARWAKKKGITLLGTGDFTHPTYLAELRAKLEPLGNGLFKLKKGGSRDPLHFDDRSEQYLHPGWKGEKNTHSHFCSKF